MRQSEFNRLVTQGVHVPPQAALVVHAEIESMKALRVARDSAFKAAGYARDAYPGLVTQPNAGVPAYLTNTMDPEIIRIVVQPMKAAEAYGETQKGNWTSLTAQFRVIELQGEVASYGDFSENGRAGHNVNYVPRESYHFQTFAEWGERETDIESLAGISYIAEQNEGAALTVAKYRNKTYFYGVAGLELYGALNDPDLIAPIAPTAKTGGGTAWTTATPPEQVYADFQSLFQQLQFQMGGGITVEDAMTLTLSPTKQVFLLNTNNYGTKAMTLIQATFPNLKIVTAPEMTTTGGDLMQLRLDKVDGKETTYCGFTERLRNHAVIQRSSSWVQKKSAGTWGFICRYPIALAQMLGI